MIRRTVSLPPDLVEAADAAVAAGAAANFSRLVAGALRSELAARRADHLARQAGELDPGEETALVEAARATGRGGDGPAGPASPWRRIG